MGRGRKRDGYNPSGAAGILDTLLAQSLELLNAKGRSALGKSLLAKSLDDTKYYWPESLISDSFLSLPSLWQ